MRAGSIYENDVLQFIGHEEGRMRVATQTTIVDGCGNNAGTQWLAFDYFIKDHLGNTRMVLTDEWQKDNYPAATMESEAAATEKTYYTKIDETRAPLPPGYPSTSSAFQPNQSAASLNAQSHPTGPGILFKVMAGDRINLRCDMWYRVNSGQSINNNSGSPLSAILLQLALGAPGISAGHLTPAQTGTGGSFFDGTVTGFLSQQPESITKPKAFVNWLLLDEQFNTAPGSSSEPVGLNEVYKEFTKLCNDAVEVQKNGYIYVYTSNESNIDVFFDNLQVSHVHGALLEETHYYPFGLEMKMLGSRAAGKVENKYQFGGKEKQDKEFSDGSGLEWYDYEARTYDAQVGRMNQIDPNSFNYYGWTPYNYCANNPIAITDPTGMDWYTDKGGKYQYDPNITKDSKLGEGQTYVGATHQVKDKKGATTEDYRKDGGIMYANESSAYTRIIDRTKQTGNESMAVLTDKGTLVLPDYKNNQSTVDLADYGYSTKNGNVVDASGKEYNTTATVHTHPKGSEPSTYTADGYGDLGLAAYSTPNKPVFVIQMQGTKTDPISFIIASPNPSRKASDFNYQVASLSKHFPSYNAQSIQSMSNSVNLRQFAKQNNNFIQLLKK